MSLFRTARLSLLVDRDMGQNGVPGMSATRVEPA
jgi:hypothetical protein